MTYKKQKSQNKRRFARGFTLVELLIVLAAAATIIGAVVGASFRIDRLIRNAEVQTNIKRIDSLQEQFFSEEEEYLAYDGGSFEDQRLVTPHKAIQSRNDVGIDSQRLFRADGSNFAVVTPTVQGTLFCLGSSDDQVTRYPERYNSAIDYAWEVRQNGWECPATGFATDENPEFRIPNTGYSQYNAVVKSDWVTPSNFNTAITLKVSGPKDDIRDDTSGTWNDTTVTLLPGESFQVRTESPTSSSGGSKAVSVDVQNSSVAKEWTIVNGVYASCLEIINDNPDASTGVYTIDPDKGGSEFAAFQVRCDMNTSYNGKTGGWTRITQKMAKEELKGTLKWGPQSGVEKGFTGTFGDDAYFKDGPGGHIGWYDFKFPNDGNGFNEFYLENFRIRAMAHSSGHTSEFGGGFDITNYTWNNSGVGEYGDVGFGTPADRTAVTSFAQENGTRECEACAITFDANGEIFSLNSSDVSTFRISSGEMATQDEGWNIWNSDTAWIYVR